LEIFGLAQGGLHGLHIDAQLLCHLHGDRRDEHTASGLFLGSGSRRGGGRFRRRRGGRAIPVADHRHGLSDVDFLTGGKENLLHDAVTGGHNIDRDFSSFAGEQGVVLLHPVATGHPFRDVAFLT